jgi:hypothetical protein
MKKCILTLLLLVAISPSVEAETSFTDELKAASSGSVSSRFRGGYYAGIGYQGRIGGDGDTRIQGLLLEGGVYGMFNPIRNFLDFEVGISGKYNTGAKTTNNNSGKSSYYSGLKQITAYGGTIFRFGEQGKALSIGVSKAFYIDEVQTKDLKNLGYKKNNLENGLGVYAEYQTDEISGGVYFVRLEIEKIDIVSLRNTNKDTVASLLFGMKF